MAYQGKVAVAIKVGGKVLRETDGAVLLPFGSEYSILVKNLNSVCIQFQASIDGSAATEGTWLVVQPDSSLELERFIRNGNWSEGNRFKFIERTPEVEAGRGIKVDDGIVRVEYQTEVVPVREEVHHIYHHHYPIQRPERPPFPLHPRDRWPRPYSYRHRYPYPYLGPARASTVSSPRAAAARSAIGITVPGSRSKQSFIPAAHFDTDSSQVIVLCLRGQLDGVEVSKPLRVDSRLTCSTCKKSNRSDAEFCSTCGTALVLI